MRWGFFMNDNARKFLADLLTTPGVSGYEQPVQAVVCDYCRDFADEIVTDLHGNVIVAVNKDAPVRLMLAGHADQIGMLVSQIDEFGFLYAQTVGGWDSQQLVGQRVTVWTSSGGIAGVISRKPIHLLDENERKQVVKAKDLWIDIGACSKDEAESTVRIGDSVTLHLGFTKLMNDRVSGPAMDDRVGVWVVMEALRRAAQRNLSCAVFSVSTVQEEIGLRGAKTAAYTVNPQVGIAVDVTHATDCPTIDKRQLGEIGLGGGPVIFRGPNVNPNISDRLVKICQEQKRAFQLAAIGRAAPNDSNALQINRSGVATGLVGIPNRYMHSAVETVSLCDIDQAADLLADFCEHVHSAQEFIPSTPASTNSPMSTD
jgi:tetrahedral aminopeptidase